MRTFNLLLLTMFVTTFTFAHGINYHEVNQGRGIVVSYENMDPMSFADVEVFRPGKSRFEFQVGMTDINGVFMFKPDTIGIWTLKVSDGLGHGELIQVSVENKEAIEMKSPPLTRMQRIISGLGYILFIFGVWYFFAQRQRSRHAHS